MAAEQEAWTSAPAPSRELTRVHFDGLAPPAPPNNPAINWTRDQPAPAPSSFVYRPGYSEHTYQQFSAPLAFDGFSLDRIRAAVTMHRIGQFWESAALMVAVLGFSPAFAALQQAIAPILALPRHVHGGEKGLAKLVAGEVEEQLVPRGGLLPSPHFPPALWGTTAIYLRMLGFAVWQHIDGDPDPDTGIRPRYTRIWEPWAVQRTRSPRKAIAYTTEGPIEICNDGKFTLVEDTNEGHLFDAAILALGEETLGGKLTQEARNSFTDFFGKPKLWAELPPNVPTSGQAGEAFLASVDGIFSPDGRGILPNGSKLTAVSISGEGSQAFQGGLLDAVIHIFMALTGSAGTIGNGMNAGAGQSYQPAKGGAWTVAHHLIARPTMAMVRAANQGHVAPYCDVNYADVIARAKRAGAWKSPVLSIPIVSPDREERIAGVIARQKALSEQVKADREAGGVVDQDRVDLLAQDFEARPFTLADATPRAGEIFEYHITNKQVAVDEVRARIGLDPLPDGIGSVERLAEERAAGADQAGALAKIETAKEKPTDEQASPAAAEETGAPAPA